MLDRDLADVYGVRPIAMRQQVKRNRGRFPKDFMFQLTAAETDVLLSQNVIPSRRQLGGFRPYVFSEHGAVMLANVLRSKRAVEMSVYVVRAFVKLRELATNHKDLIQRIQELEKKYDAQFHVVFDAIRKLMGPSEPPKRRIGYRVEASQK